MTSLAQEWWSEQESFTQFEERPQYYKQTNSLSHRAMPSENPDGSNTAKFENKQQDPVAFPIPDTPRPGYHLQSLCRWEGTIVRLRGQTLIARLRNLDNPSSPLKTASIALDEVSDDDKAHAVVGSIFYWVIGYRIESYGQKSLTSSIRFRRLPAWTKRDLQRVQTMSRELESLFSNDSE